MPYLLTSHALQSSSESNTNALANSIDGDINTCFETNTETNPWWIIDLEREYIVSSIVLTTSQGQTDRVKTDPPNYVIMCNLYACVWAIIFAVNSLHILKQNKLVAYRFKTALSSFEVSVGQQAASDVTGLDAAYTLCHDYSGTVQAGVIETIACDESHQARYVALIKRASGVTLHFCELEVIGGPGKPKKRK